MRLHYTSTNHRSGETTHYDYCVELTTKPQPFGGRRWWWICPNRRRLVSNLYMPPEGGTFASRKAHRLAYRCQRQSPSDRAISRAFKLRHRLGGTGGIGAEIDKLKGMRWATFDRKMEQVDAAKTICDANLAPFIQKLAQRSKSPKR
jgi:hypothetical protein